MPKKRDARTLTPGARRMRASRKRRRRGFYCVVVEVGADDVAGLVARGLLDRLNQDDDAAIQGALHAWLDRLALPQASPDARN